MCMCGKPTINGEDGYSWDGKQVFVRKPDPPQINDTDTVLFDEPGRCGGIDSHCHHHTVVKNGGRYELLTRNGSGDHQIRLSNGEQLVEALDRLDTNGRYWMLNAIYHAQSDGERNGVTKTDRQWRQAAAEKRIKTRKQRNQGTVKVWIEPKIELTPA